MMKKIAIIIGAFCVLILGVTLYINTQTNATLPESEIIDTLEDRFNAQVEEIRTGEDGGQFVYHTEITTIEGLYYVKVNGTSGVIEEIDLLELNEDGDRDEREVLSLEEVNTLILDSVGETANILEIERLDQEGRTVYQVIVEQEDGIGTFEMDGITGEVLLYTLEEQEETPTEPISEQEASTIALGEVPGEVEDINLVQKNGRLVYDIEIDNDATDQEATILIDALTGEVISVTIED